MNKQTDVLRILSEKKGEYVSGAEISEILGVSRTTVSNAVSSLQAKGYDITAKHCSGYMYVSGDRVIDVKRISAETGIRAEYHDVLPSTNDEAKILAAERKESAVIIARRQTSGRARHEKKFKSDVEGAYFTVLIKENMPFGATELISDAALNEVLRLCGGERVENTIVKEGEKLCGVLAESIADTDLVRYAVIGVGIYDKFGLPPRTDLIISVATAALKKAFSLSR